MGGRAISRRRLSPVCSIRYGAIGRSRSRYSRLFLSEMDGMARRPTLVISIIAKASSITFSLCVGSCVVNVCSVLVPHFTVLSRSSSVSEFTV